MSEDSLISLSAMKKRKNTSMSGLWLTIFILFIDATSGKMFGKFYLFSNYAQCYDVLGAAWLRGMSAGGPGSHTSSDTDTGNGRLFIIPEQTHPPPLPHSMLFWSKSQSIQFSFPKRIMEDGRERTAIH